MIPVISHLLPFLSLPDVEEVFVNGSRGLAILRKCQHEHLPLPAYFNDNAEFISACQDLAIKNGLRLDPFCPFAGGILDEEGLRWHCVIPPASPGGPIFALRKHRFGDLGIDDFAAQQQQLMKLRTLIEEKTPILFCGETGSGKTTLLVACLKASALDDRVLIVEELEEIPLLGRLWAKLLTKVAGVHGGGALSLESLFRECLRLRPDRLVFGELRGADIRWFIEAISSGHEGVLASFHAGSLSQLKQRMLNEPFDSGVLREREVYAVFLERHYPCKIIEITRICT